MAEQFTIGQGDTWPPIQAALKDAEGAAVDITGATVEVNMKAAGGSLTIDHGAADILVPASGTVEYEWETLDTATAGSYTFEWEVTFSDGKIATFPNTTDKIEVTITPQLG